MSSWIVPIDVLPEMFSDVVLEVPKIAVPSGTAGLDDQLVPVVHSLVAGAASQVPSTA